MKAKIIDMLTKVDEDKFKIELTHLSKGKWSILITSKYDNCTLCKKSYKVELLRVRQVSKVPILQTSKMFCPKCVKKIDYIIDNWKGREPRTGEILCTK